MKSSTCESLKVFDFNEEDEMPELSSSRIMSKFKNPNPLDKYSFLETFAQETKTRSKEIGNVPCVDVDAVYGDQKCDYTVSYTPLDAGVDCAIEGMPKLDDFAQHNSTGHEQDPRCIPNKLQPGSVETRDSSPESASLEKIQLNCSLPQSPSSDESADVIPDSDENHNESFQSSSSETEVDGDSLDEPSSEHRFTDWEMGERDMAVHICPDYIVYHDKYCIKSCQLIFSSSCITMKGSGNQGGFSCQWRIDDVIDIESKWFGRFEMVMVKLRIISKDSVQSESARGTSGIEELKFSVVDSNWYEKQEEITSLDKRYSALWTVVFDADVERLGGASDVCSQQRYFPNFDEPFEEVVYPKGDPDAVSVSKRDVDMLQPDTFVNDTIIDFYIKYLKNKIQPEERHRFHFFNSFFFRKLADFDKDPSGTFEGTAAFQRVRKWTRKVNLFEKDYVFIPVNFHYHWSLIVICHPGEVAKFEDDKVEKSFKVPCILHMDSIRGTHSGLKNLVQSYLWEEWKEKQKETSEDISSKFSNLRYVPLELPQQQNCYDCGLFLLHYVELFLEEAPVNFNPFKITKFSSFLNVDWFLPAEAYLKRTHIQRLICELLENHSREISQPSTGDKHFTSNCPKSINDDETGVEVVSERCSPKCNNGNSLCSLADEGIEITLLPTSSLRNSQCATDSTLAFREFFEPGVTVGSLLDGQYQSFNRAASFNEFKRAMSPMEEDSVAARQFVYSPEPETGEQRLSEIASKACAFPYLSREFEAETSWDPEISVHKTGHEDFDSSPETSASVSGSSEVEIKDYSSALSEDLDLRETLDHKRSPSPENGEYLTESYASAGEMLDLPDSQQPDLILEGNGDTDSLTGCKNVVEGNGDKDSLMGSEDLLPESSLRDHEVQENRDGSCDDRMIDDDLVPETDMRAAKRPRLVPPIEEN